MRLVLLHALPLNGQQWAGQMDLLPGRTFAPTLYSFGDTMEEWASGVLDAAGDGPLIVVGNSVGGSCALEMARQAPDRVRALVLVGTKAGHRPEPEFRDKFIAALAEQPAATVVRWVNELLCPTSNAETRERICAISNDQHVGDLIRGVRVFHSRPDAEEVVVGWQKPLIWIAGEHDGVHAAFAEMRQTSALPQSTAPTSNRSQRQLRTAAGCGHYVNLERPDEFNTILKEVVASCIIKENRKLDLLKVFARTSKT